MTYDFAIIGAGIAGASLAAELAPHGRVLLLEAEAMPGYHATGRSAAFWSETYGGPSVQPLTTASHAFLSSPPPDFSERGFLEKCGALHIATAQSHHRLDAFAAEFAGSGVELGGMTYDDMAASVPGLRPQWDRAITEPSCANIDVGGLHQAYLRSARRGGAEIRCSAQVEKIEAAGPGWRISAGGALCEAVILVNAAGAWADEIAAMAGLPTIGIAPYRRTMIQLRTDPPAPAQLPLVIDAAGAFYFKGEAGDRLWLSPHDETAVPPGDVAAEEIDIAVAIERLESAVDWTVVAVERKWAGLRSFAPDRLPVYGFDPLAPGFFWCAGQGGFGIQTAPAAARLCRALQTGELPEAGIDAALYAPDRFRR
ncbi:NAD(P)/FAD-dependent oxidoreductase [Parasphingopyxis marina]|uniref:FAD-binding oxidoreductase n=1 Tax=Parasphingopyxis marina TaxID=2761622 RepID=A0A842HYG1_9SPHN|nr:FAD-dependent oxidoreductase [Parasphingopyxis marina]MBC2777473.1 FAD-binding oxidoreductase [Parasphingopyxis marina]